GILAVGLLGLPAPAAAGFFERLFGGFRQAQPPAIVQSFADPLTSLGNAIGGTERVRPDNGPAKAFCVRSCDGHFFPVQAHAGLTAAESCRAFCPAAKTALYSGSNIDTAAASDGSRYADMANAFVYRKQLVAGCTCNGRDQFGLARMDAMTDPTLRPGDVVATKTGLMAYTATRNQAAEFTPISDYRGLSKTTRETLSETKILPVAPRSAIVAATIPTAGARTDDRRRAQLAR
ncbi:MAG: DUF2865 domain-containing protein, partial [Pseudolabrys sp.]